MSQCSIEFLAFVWLSGLNLPSEHLLLHARDLTYEREREKRKSRNSYRYSIFRCPINICSCVVSGIIPWHKDRIIFATQLSSGTRQFANMPGCVFFILCKSQVIFSFMFSGRNSLTRTISPCWGLGVSFPVGIVLRRIRLRASLTCWIKTSYLMISPSIVYSLPESLLIRIT